MLYIVASMVEEIAGLRRDMASDEQRPSSPLSVQFHTLGIGPERAGNAMANVLAGGKRLPDSVLMLGVAGAILPGMQAGDIVLAESYLLDAEPNAAAAEVPHPEMLQAAQSAAESLGVSASRESSLTVDRLITEVWHRQQLRERYGAGSVNMEDYTVAAACRDAGVPFLSARVILDTAEQSLPGYLPKLSKGRSRVVTHVLLQPWRIPKLLTLRSQMDRAQEALTRFGSSYIEMEAERQKNARQEKASGALY